MHSQLPLCYFYLGLHLVGVKKTSSLPVCVHCFPRGFCVSNKTMSPELRAVCNKAWQRSANPKVLTSAQAHTDTWRTLPGMQHEWEIHDSLRILFPGTRGGTHYLIPHNVRHIIQPSSRDRDCRDERDGALPSTHTDLFRVKTSSSAVKPHWLVHVVTHHCLLSEL